LIVAKDLEDKLAEQLFGHGKPGQSIGALDAARDALEMLTPGLSAEKMQADLLAASFSLTGRILFSQGEQEGATLAGPQQALGGPGFLEQQERHQERGGRDR
jgi:hypothetical protein